MTSALARIMTIVFVIVVGCVPVAQIVVELRGGSHAGGTPDARATPATPGHGLLDAIPSAGDIRALEERVEARSLLRAHLLPPAQQTLTAVLGVGNEQVIVARGGQLFYAPDVRHVTGRPFLDVPRAGRGPVGAILDFARQLRERGIELVLVPVPVKPQLEHAVLGAARDAPAVLRNPSHGAFTERMVEACVHVFDPAPVLRELREAGTPPFLRTDTHWSPAGVRAVAAALGDFLKRRGLTDRDPDGVFTLGTETIETRGDLLAMLGLPDGSTAVEPETVTVTTVRDARGRDWSPDPRADVLLLGDSFTNIFSLAAMRHGASAGLAEHVSVELGRPVDVIARNAGGAAGARRELARAMAGADRLAGKRVVVYQFATRELLLGDWPIVNLPAASGAAPPANDARPSERVVRATVVAASACPDPASVPYPDAIVSLHLRDLVSADGEGTEDEIVAYAMGLRAGRRTPIAGVAAGASVELVIAPWSSVTDRLGGLARVELDEPRLLELPVYWAEPSRRAELERLADDADARGSAVVAGRDGFLFFGPELRFLAASPAATDAACTVIADFDRQLRHRAIELLVVPVPCKATIHADRLPDATPTHVRNDAVLQHALQRLRADGVRVLDLVPALRAALGDGPEAATPTYCRTDTHPTPSGIAVMARGIAEAVRRDPSWSGVAWDAATVTEPLEIAGDLAAMRGVPGGEIVALPRFTKQYDVIDRASPIVLLGDSHVLVYSVGGELHAANAGLPEQLAHALGRTVDVVGVRGSGATATRVNLRRRGDDLAGKRLLIWVFAARDLTEGRWQAVRVLGP